MKQKTNKGEKVCENEKGDESMEITKNIPKLDMNFILTHGKPISSQEVLKDVTAVSWGKKVLDGKYKNKTIIAETKEGDT